VFRVRNTLYNERLSIYNGERERRGGKLYWRIRGTWASWPGGEGW
jgi:hypothetical protein